MGTFDAARDTGTYGAARPQTYGVAGATGNGAAGATGTYGTASARSAWPGHGHVLRSRGHGHIRRGWGHGGPWDVQRGRQRHFDAVARSEVGGRRRWHRYVVVGFAGAFLDSECRRHMLLVSRMEVEVVVTVM